MKNATAHPPLWHCSNRPRWRDRTGRNTTSYYSLYSQILKGSNYHLVSSSTWSFTPVCIKPYVGRLSPLSERYSPLHCGRTGPSPSSDPRPVCNMSWPLSSWYTSRRRSGCQRGLQLRTKRDTTASLDSEHNLRLLCFKATNCFSNSPDTYIHFLSVY